MDKKQLFVLLVLIAAVFAMGIAAFRFGSIGTHTIWQASNNGKWLFPLVTVSALLDSINICAFSILLLTVAFLFSLGTIRSGILKIGGAYIFGIFLVYLLIGLGIVHTLYLFNTPHFMAKVGALILIGFGLLTLINEFFPAFPVKLKIPASAHRQMAKLMEKGSIPGAFLLGGLVGACAFPCTGGPYLLVLGLLHDTATYASGFAYLLYYNFVFVLPLILMLLIASNRVLLEKVQQWRKEETRKLRLISGLVMIILGFLILVI